MRQHGKHRTPAEELDADMTATDLVETLERLQFTTEHRLISLDRDVRDYLVRKLKPPLA
jgi:hypothetical protein